MQHSVATHPPTTPLREFVVDIERTLDAHASGDGADLVAAMVERRLTTLLTCADVLLPEDRIPWPDHYRPHLLTVAPSRRFSVLALIWLPGQMTPIHDHICWCVVGVLEGVEREQRFSLRQDSSGQRWLTPGSDALIMPGDVSCLIPPAENIHQVRNAGSQLAISLHVYGADISVLGSSVNQCFDELPLHEMTAAPNGQRVGWRRTPH